MRRTTALLATLALVLTLFPAAAMAAPSATGTWIVQLRADVNPATTAGPLSRAHGGSVGHVYQHAINGFSFRGSAAAATALARNPKVILVEADAEVWLDTTQTGATWGLDRIDQRDLPLSGTYSYNTTGAGVTAYVIDSGILTTHAEFGGRAMASAAADFVGDGRNGQDCNGHGTHVAGTIGGSTYGVAKQVNLVSVRVFGCTGGSTWETIIAGINWVIGHHGSGPAVANMSLGGGANSSIDTATNNLISDGVATAVAAGNGNFIGRQADACKYSPARVPAAMTISATDSTDRKASWANYGNCVDWFAPGVSITSAWYTGNTATNTISGTSMATPHTAGVAALYLEANPGASPATVRTVLYDATTKNKVSSSSTTNNHLLYSLVTDGGGDPPPDENTAPVANNDSAETDEDVAVIIAVLANDTDAENDELSVASFTQPTSGRVVLNADETFTYTPNLGYFGADSFNYQASDGALTSNTATVSVTVREVTEPPPPGGITLSVSGYKIRGVQHANLTWSGATSTNVDVYRNGTKITTTDNDGAHTDNIGGRGGGTYTYEVCEAGTNTCSNEATASF